MKTNLKTGGIYKTVDSNSYIVIITIRAAVYYYQVINAQNNSIPINRQYIINTLNEQIDEISLSEQHDFFLRTKEENIEKNLDGYLGTILTDQLYTLQQELNTVEFDKNGYGY